MSVICLSVRFGFGLWSGFGLSRLGAFFSWLSWVFVLFSCVSVLLCRCWRDFLFYFDSRLFCSTSSVFHLTVSSRLPLGLFASRLVSGFLPVRLVPLVTFCVCRVLSGSDIFISFCFRTVVRLVGSSVILTLFCSESLVKQHWVFQMKALWTDPGPDPGLWVLPPSCYNNRAVVKKKKN